jgi:N-acetylglucosamine kinase-like BadF-type ATPase
VKYFAGVDGGQSSTIAVIGDESGRVLGRGVSAPADEIGAGHQSTRLYDALVAALDRARANAGLARETRFEIIVAGVSGYEGRVYGREPQLPTERLVLLHDAPIAHAGALGAGSGVVVIAGTGSVAYIVDDDDRRAMQGGWGYLFGDDGSAFWIAREALRNALHAREHQTEKACATEASALTFFSSANLRDIVAAFYHGAIPRDRMASFAAPIIELAEDGDACAVEAVRKGQRALALLAMGATAAPWRWRDRPRVAFVGGLLRSPSFKAGLYDELATLANGALDLVEPQHEPAVGALMLAYRRKVTEKERS